ncbi:MBL fold metallo-hydrolase [Methylobacterium sp. V23]|uniref:MBL fold metallo-hydrolase n=1 Tax=Methylobacterium sp. V23 TaxID=2044878 RepID=UPI000CDAEFA2|nr:MBL fold metallo-hydrolase [Methylobacterium sp. V23]POR42024.1 MBL fold metallo-hydrolase [Methylobacterium sp. V23]
MTELTRRHLATTLVAGFSLPRSALAGTSTPNLAPNVLAPHVLPPNVPVDGLQPIRLGTFTVTALRDADAVIDGPWPIVGEDRPKAEVEALMRENHRSADRFSPGFTPILVRTGRETVLFDTGNGAVGFIPRPAGGQLAQRVRQAGLSPEDIDLVVLTHCHTDHIGGLLEDGRPLFPNARYVVGEREFAFWTDDDRLAAAPEGNAYRSARVFRSHLLPLADRIRLVSPGQTVVPGIDAVAAFGHTPGHLAFHVESAGQRLLVWGDCAHHEVASLARPNWHALFDMDKAAGAATRRTIYDMAATDRVLVAGYHTAFPSLGYVIRDGLGYRWRPMAERPRR